MLRIKKMRNPIRRSRKIGISQGGRVKNGRADEKWSRLFPDNKWRQISHSEKLWEVFVENPSRDFYHPCKPEDYLAVLEKLPDHHTDNIKGIILRRTPKRDERMGVDAWRRWSCIIMNSFPKNNRYIYRKKPNASIIKFFEPFCTNWSQEENKWFLTWNEEQVRKYYLYQIFLHEVGHINDYSNNLKSKREKYADSFARDMAEWLGSLGSE